MITGAGSDYLPLLMRPAPERDLPLILCRKADKGGMHETDFMECQRDPGVCPDGIP